MFDLKVRSLAKGISWRLVAIVVLTTVSWVITNDIKRVSLIVFLYHTMQIFIYFFHERFWEKISWGKSKGLFIQMTGLSGSGKSTLAFGVQKRLQQKGAKVEIIDGDEYRTNLCSDLGFSENDRKTNIRRLGFVGEILSRNNVISIMSAINPYELIRDEIGGKKVFVNCNLGELKRRDTKGLYRRACLPLDHPEYIPNFTGISDPFEIPSSCDLIINTDSESLEESISKLEKFILDNIKM